MSEPNYSPEAIAERLRIRDEAVKIYYSSEPLDISVDRFHLEVTIRDWEQYQAPHDIRALLKIVGEK